MTYDLSEYAARAAKKGTEAALEDIITGNDRSGEDVIADTEVLVFDITGKKLHELDEDIIIEILEAHDEAYIDTYVAGQKEEL